MNRKPLSYMGMITVLIILVIILSGCSKDVNTSKGATSASASTLTSSTKDEPNSLLVEEQTSEPSERTVTTPGFVTTIDTDDLTTGAPINEFTSSNETFAGEKVAEVPLIASTSVEEPNEGIFDPWYDVSTSIAYSSGTDSDWSYGNQRKEFSTSKPCYVRIGSSIVAIWHWGWRYGNGSKINVVYRFTGAEHCKIEISDGFASEVITGDPNIVEFRRAITAKGSSDEDVVVFRYTPSLASNVSLEVIYDNQIKSKFNERNTVYFVNDEW